MPLTRSVAAAAAAAIALNAPTVSAADMTTTNDMPTTAGGACRKQACLQGVLFAEAITFNDEFDTPTFSYAMGEDFGGQGWDAGPVTKEDTMDLYDFEDAACQLTLRGVTIIRIMDAMVGSNKLNGNNDDATFAPLIQYNNVRVRYSTTLPATNRLLSVEIKDPATGEYKPINRTALYTVNAQKYDYTGYEPYKQWTASPGLTAEGVKCSDIDVTGGDLINKFLTAKSPYTIPNVSQALTSEAGGTAMVVEQDAAFCKAMTPPQAYHAGLASCEPCPPGSTSTGSDCVSAATATPVTPTPVSPTTAPAHGSAPTSAATVPSGSATRAPASSSSASSVAGSTGAATASPPGPTSAPAATGADTAGGAAGGAAAPSSGSSTGLNIGIVVGVVALIAVAAIVGFVVMRSRGSAAATACDGLDSRLEPVNGDQPVADVDKAGSQVDDFI